MSIYHLSWSKWSTQSPHALVSVHFSDILCVAVTWSDLRGSPGLTVIQPLFILLFINWIIATVNTVCLVCTGWICSCCVCYCVCQHCSFYHSPPTHHLFILWDQRTSSLFFSLSLFHIRHEIFSVTKEDLLWLHTVNIVCFSMTLQAFPSWVFAQIIIRWTLQ